MAPNEPWGTEPTQGLGTTALNRASSLFSEKSASTAQIPQSHCHSQGGWGWAKPGVQNQPAEDSVTSSVKKQTVKPVLADI